MSLYSISLFTMKQSENNLSADNIHPRRNSFFIHLCIFNGLSLIYIAFGYKSKKLGKNEKIKNENNILLPLQIPKTDDRSTIVYIC